MAVRRVLTGHDANGRSVLVEDAIVPAAENADYPGFEPHEVWAVDGTVTVPVDGPPTTGGAYFPPVDGVRFQVIVFPPGFAGEDTWHGDDATNDPLMHETDSVDYIYIASGSVLLKLDDGSEVDLNAGDTVVQQGVRHAWRNPGAEPCVVVGTLVGARRRTQ